MALARTDDIEKQAEALARPGRYTSPDRRASARTGRVLAGCEPIGASRPRNRKAWRKLAATLRAKGVTNATELKKAAEGLDKSKNKA